MGRQPESPEEKALDRSRLPSAGQSPDWDVLPHVFEYSYQAESLRTRDSSQREFNFL